MITLTPQVNTNIAIATEASDDDGCPHVLEHLIFLGSDDYPYKGVLDKLANRRALMLILTRITHATS
ncbi:hypothetical protein AKO1_000673 [Acrasis kona]|uniref:Peptidase M16 N-terminal domain-containing protein n=1 Tax=Acrasis kona TaxID=1008807 RepID=A0AAW2YRD6_9EUKA